LNLIRILEYRLCIEDPDPVHLADLECRPWDFLENSAVTMENHYWPEQLVGCSNE
jgi:hypothetical protein